MGLLSRAYVRVRVESSNLRHVANAGPFTGFYIQARRYQVVRARFSNRYLMLFFNVARVVYHRGQFVIARRGQSVAAYVHHLLLRFVRRPGCLQRVFTAIGCVASGRRVINSGAPVMIFVGSVITSRRTRRTVRLTVKIERRGRFVQLSMLPFQAFSQVRLRVGQVAPFIIHSVGNRVLEGCYVDHVFCLPLNYGTCSTRLSIQFVGRVESIYQRFLLLLLVAIWAGDSNA